MAIKNLVKWGNINPKRLFLVDGLGAVVSAALLGIVLVKLENVFGIPKSTLYFLASLPCLFAIYDFYCYLKIDNQAGLLLKGIAITNLVYCCISIGLAIYHIKDFTYFGWLYILIEVAIVITIAFAELRVAQNQITRSFENQ